MLALHYNRLFFSIGLAAVLSLSVPRGAEASIISSTDAAGPCDTTPNTCFGLHVVDPADYVAGDNSGDGDVTFTFSNNQKFDVQITNVRITHLNCIQDCQDDKGGDYVTNPFIDTGTTCGSPGFLRKNAQNSCTVQVGFSLRDDRRPDPDTDYGLWNLFVQVDGIKAGDANSPGLGIGLGAIYGVDKGATAPEPSSFFLILAGVLALLLPRVVSALRSLRVTSRQGHRPLRASVLS